MKLITRGGEDMPSVVVSPHYNGRFPCNGRFDEVNHPTLLGLASRNRSADAWMEFERNSLHWQENTFPTQWVGIWSSSDTADSDGLPGNPDPNSKPTSG